ncbi:MAG: PAS domain-containing protein [Alphaproteobacteria bacterium]|nr:PAS domain-containing protein [Alphaproteobacteria bacterium]
MRERTTRTHDGIWIRPLEDPTQLHDVHQRAVFEFWLAARTDEDMPPPARIDPIELPKGSLPMILVKECEASTGRYRTRLAGTAFREATGFDGTHLYSDSLDGSAGTVDRFNWAVGERKPYWYQGSLAFSTNDLKQFSVLVLPFAEPDQPVTRLLCVFDFDPDTDASR